MESKNTDIDFKYTYSAKEQDEIKRIRQKYMVQEEDGMTRLRKLDAKVNSKATMMSLVLGIIGALVMGTGMSLIMTDLSEIFGMTVMEGMLIGVVVGLIGMTLVALAYPIYKKVLKSQREKIAPEIFRLSEELLK
ncbi:MAG: hypothetical protein IKW30_12060 [Lachnospiraceae bacterium]|nr:hypothetical protein [Lachnospiraceae bacterium]